MPYPQGFQKAQLQIDGGDTIECAFNPETYTVSKTNIWTYKPTPDWNITLGADNFTSWRFELQQVNYTGPRNLGQVSNIQDVLTRTQPRFYLNLRKTF